MDDEHLLLYLEFPSFSDVHGQIRLMFDSFSAALMRFVAKTNSGHSQ